MAEEHDSGSIENLDELAAVPGGEGFLGPSSDRRRFLTAAAVGTAAAGMYGGASLFRPLAAYADDLSNLNCTANDVRIVGPGVVINEPCNCSGVFDAKVRFRVINNTGTTRYCVTVHFCPGTNGFAPGDVLIGDIPPKSDAFYTVTIPNYPCGSGLVCFGACGQGTDPDTGQSDCSFAKGEACPGGQCCTTISWDVNPGCPNRVISSKCRHQQVCIQGRGKTTIACPSAGCNTCGGSIDLTVCTTEPANQGPFTFQLLSGGAVVATFGPTTDKCHTFTVSPSGAQSYTGRVISADGCAKESSAVTVSDNSFTASLGYTGGCDGKLTFTASTGKEGCSYEFFVDGTSVQSGASNTYVYGPSLDGACHAVRVKATCGACESSAEKSVSQCVTTTAC